MAKDTLTLSLSGEIPLDLFAKVIVDFTTLLLHLAAEVVGPNEIEWEITRLQGGSADTTVTGIYDDEEAVEKVVRAYSVVGQSLEAKKPIPYSEDVVSAAVGITSHLDGKITSVRFITDEYTASIQEAVPETIQEEAVYSLGVISGIVGAIWERPKTKLGIYDALFDKVVYCFLSPQDHELMREVWGKRVEVSGRIRRDPDTGRPIDVRDVNKLEVVESGPIGSYKRAKGAIPWRTGMELSEVVIGRLRNGL